MQDAVRLEGRDQRAPVVAFVSSVQSVEDLASRIRDVVRGDTRRLAIRMAVARDLPKLESAYRPNAGPSQRE